MKNFKYGMLLILVLGLIACTESDRENNTENKNNEPGTPMKKIRGALSVDGDITMINHVYTIDINDNDLMIILTDKPVKKGSTPDEISVQARERKFKGVTFVITKDTHEIQTEVAYTQTSALYYQPIWSHTGDIGKGQLRGEQLEEEKYAGTIITPAINTLDGHQYFYNIAFSIDL